MSLNPVEVPQGLKVDKTTDTEVSVSCTAISGATEYVFVLSVNPTFVDRREMTSLSPNTTFGKLTPNTTYSVTAYGSDGTLRTKQAVPIKGTTQAPAPARKKPLFDRLATFLSLKNIGITVGTVILVTFLLLILNAFNFKDLRKVTSAGEKISAGVQAEIDKALKELDGLRAEISASKQAEKEPESQPSQQKMVFQGTNFISNYVLARSEPYQPPTAQSGNQQVGGSETQPSQIVYEEDTSREVIDEEVVIPPGTQLVIQYHPERRPRGSVFIKAIEGGDISACDGLGNPLTSRRKEQNLVKMIVFAKEPSRTVKVWIHISDQEIHNIFAGK